MIARLLDRLRYRRIVGGEVVPTASGDRAWIGVHRRWRRPVEIEMRRGELLDLAEAILAGECDPPATCDQQGDR